MRIAVDAMGGDFAPAAIVAGAVLAARDRVPLTLVGARFEIERELAHEADAAGLDIRVLDADEVISMEDEPSSVLRRKRRASVVVAAGAVARGEADAMFSAGHTGATVLAAHKAFGLVRGADRPALAATVPTAVGTAVLIDAGANADCRPAHLVRFAVMGTVFARVALGVAAPRVALLSSGEEASKGNDLTRDAHQLLKTSGVRFIGNLEARDVFTGQADVIVCDGFTGNIALKVSEGLAETIDRLVRDAFAGGLASRVAYLLSRGAFRQLQERLDQAEYGGAPLLGVDGLCLVGHGRSSPKAVRSAIVLAARYAQQGLLAGLRRELAVVESG